MKRLGLGPILGALVLILILSMFTFLLSRSEDTTSPSAKSVLPSGLGAFAELLRQDGFEVVVDRSEKPDLKPDDLAIAASVKGEGFFFTESDTPSRTLKKLNAHLSAAGRILELRLPPDFVEASHKAKPAQVVEKQKLTTVGNVTVVDTSSTGLGLPDPDPEYTLDTYQEKSLVSVYSPERGITIVVSSAIGALNRFLSQDDNAEFYLGLVRKFAKPSGRVVFVEATIGEFDAKGLLSTFGPWAVAAQWQFALLALIVAYSVSRRFGLAVDDTFNQRGARQLVDAMAEVFRSARKLNFAAQILAASALDTVRVGLRLPPGSSNEAVLSKAPLAFVEAYSTVVGATASGLSKARLIEAVRAMQSEARHSQAKI